MVRCRVTKLNGKRCRNSAIGSEDNVCYVHFYAAQRAQVPLEELKLNGFSIPVVAKLTPTLQAALGSLQRAQKGINLIASTQ